MLKELDKDLWVVDHPHRMWGLDMRTRMTVLRLAGGDLVLVSPVPIDESLAARLAELGPVRWLVAPNRYHHVYMDAARRRYPEARLVGAPGIARKRKDLRFDVVLDCADADPTPAAWAGQLSVAPLAGCPEFDELTLYHRASRTLVVTDLLMNVHRAQGVFSRWAFQLEGCWRRPGVPRLIRLFIRDKRAAAQSATRLLTFDVARIVMAHGEILEESAEHPAMKPLLETLLRPILGPSAVVAAETA